MMTKPDPVWLHAFRLLSAGTRAEIERLDEFAWTSNYVEDEYPGWWPQEVDVDPFIAQWDPVHAYFGFLRYRPDVPLNYQSIWSSQSPPILYVMGEQAAAALYLGRWVCRMKSAVRIEMIQ